MRQVRRPVDRLDEQVDEVADEDEVAAGVHHEAQRLPLVSRE